MIDREKVIRDLRYIKSFGRVGNKPQLTEIAESAIELLEEKEAEISFLKGMQLQTMHNMSDEDIGNAVAQVIGLKDR